MVARITMPASLHKALNYNEQKVQQGVAACIGASGFLLPAGAMNFYEKREVFEHRNALNDRASTKTLHVSLNFAPDESLEREKLLQIAGDYMDGIGFGKQPYLVYHHYDAGHPHIHILSTTIRADGTRIPTHNIGRNQSEKTRKALEEKYGLEKASQHGRKRAQSITPFSPEKLRYGVSETRRGIANVVEAVIRDYSFVSLPQFNAVLGVYNVYADTGAEGGWIQRKGGLLYHALDADGNRIGVPVKASRLPGSPTLSALEKRFAYNRADRKNRKRGLKSEITRALARSPGTLNDFAAELKHRNISLILRRSEDGRVFGMTYVDHNCKTVCNGSELGKTFSAAGIIAQLGKPAVHGTVNSPAGTQTEGLAECNGVSGIAELMTPVDTFNPVPYGLKKRKRKRKR